jgi:hypothetical protein
VIVACLDGQRDCDGLANNGCEATPSDIHNCGLCGFNCNFANGVAACQDGHCALSGCMPSYGDCDNNPDNGCETTLDSSDHCGACDTTCGAIAHGSAACTAGNCAIAECNAGYGDCNGNPTDGCETQLDSTDHCGTCEQACSFTGSGATCNAMTCVPDGCNVGLGDCDGNPDNGCETGLGSDPANCGACGSPCQANLLANTQVATCSNSSCRPTTCLTGYGNCDNVPSNGCEASLRTLSDCGACGIGCAFPNGVGNCDTGTCAFVRCAPGWGNCDGNTSNGCETPLNTLSNCGACNMACTVSSGTPSCTGGICSNASCNPGFADCDGNGTSCETDLSSDNNHCGSCSATCGSLPHASGSCQGGQCTIQMCSAGYGNCDGNPDNGCETPLNTVSNCGTCGNACGYSHAAASCNAGTCAIGACNPGWASCDGNNNNGCETQLNTLTNCAACGDVCDLPNAVEACSSGSCVVVTCDSDDFGNCDNKDRRAHV